MKTSLHKDNLHYAGLHTALDIFRFAVFFGLFSFFRLSSKIVNFCCPESYRTQKVGKILPWLNWCDQEKSSKVIRRLAMSPILF